jgi:ribosomal protein L32
MKAQFKNSLKQFVQLLPASYEQLHQSLQWDKHKFHRVVRKLTEMKLLQFEYNGVYKVHPKAKLTKLFPLPKQPKIRRYCESCKDELLDFENLNICSQCEVEKLSNRICKGCKHPLPKSRYYKCLSCQPVLPMTDSEFIYYG